MTKQESLNKAAQEFGYEDFDKFILLATGIIPIVEREEIDKIIHRAMDIYAGGWISVEERLPEVAGYYLVVVDEKVASSRRGVVEISDCYKTIYSGKETLCFQPYVTHWQPLPIAP